LRLGIFGGTFDPIHFGHLLIAEETRVTLRLDRVLFVPAAVPPHKLGYPILPIEHRLAMIKLAIEDNPTFEISTVDVDRPSPHYSADTVRLLREEWKTAQEKTHFIMGADSLAKLLTWHQPERILQHCRLAVVSRPPYVVNLAQLEAAIPKILRNLDWIDMPIIGISSSDLQQRVCDGRSIRYQVPPAVAAYVAQHNLYRSPASLY
jgi:nicotinate-nucleotide adenylyltransferase